MEIKKFDKANLKQMRNVINLALTAALAEHGLTASLGNISYSDFEFGGKLKVICGSVEDAEKAEFEKYAPLFNVNVNQYQSQFLYNDKVFTLIGFKPRSTKYPVVGMKDRKHYKFPLEAIANI